MLELASEISLDLNDHLFDENTELNRILSEIPDEHFESLTSEEKWKRIFKSSELPNVYILVSKILSSDLFCSTL